jgi:hypothetical protein
VWQRSWKSFNADGAALLAQIRTRDGTRKFDFDGAYPYTNMLAEQVKGGNQSWAIRWYAHAFINEKLVLYPRRAVTCNIGFDGSGTHGGRAGGYERVQLADRSIAVPAIEVQESAMARQAWKAALNGMAGPTKVGLASELKSRLRRVYRPLARYLRKSSP